jgi:pimeloyl-ACP methyl ester carboxylesterase
LPKGHVLRRARHDDPAHEYFVYVPTSAAVGAPLFVGVHGISRNAEELAHRFSEHCESSSVVLVAPYFSQGHSADYQRLGRTGRGPRADAALHSILEEIAWLTGAETTRFHLFGFSGGAQFAHRYTMAYPHRVTAAVVASAGWYTLPDPRRRFPYGIRATRDLPGVRFDLEEFLRVPITVMVGEQDTSTADLRSSRRAARQGQDRLDRARNWVGCMHAAARACRIEPCVSLEVIPGGSHSFTALMESGRLGDRVFAALFGASGLGPSGDGHG